MQPYLKSKPNYEIVEVCIGDEEQKKPAQQIHKKPSDEDCELDLEEEAESDLNEKMQSSTSADYNNHRVNSILEGPASQQNEV
jgi:hypothetical protein